jgi:hypothetical protein
VLSQRRESLSLWSLQLDLYLALVGDSDGECFQSVALGANGLAGVQLELVAVQWAVKLASADDPVG